LSGHTNHHVQPEPIAGPSTYFILPKPGVPVAPPKLSLAKEVMSIFLLAERNIEFCCIFSETKGKGQQKQSCCLKLNFGDGEAFK